jgi:hypothetical protein
MGFICCRHKIRTNGAVKLKIKYIRSENMMEKYLNTGVKQVISKFSALTPILEEYDGDYADCKEHNLSMKEELEPVSKISGEISYHPGKVHVSRHGTLNIIGISALYHDSACCLLQDGVLKAAAQEERFTRKKFDCSMPVNAFRYCLEEAGLSIKDIDCLAYYENPEKKLARQLWSGYAMDPGELAYKLDPGRPEIEIRELLGYE